MHLGYGITKILCVRQYCDVICQALQAMKAYDCIVFVFYLEIP
jgi:hypothetical protein